MPTTGAPGNIWYPDATSPVAPLENLFLQQATSVNDALSALTPGSAWTNYTPTFTNLTLGNGTIIAKHRKIGASVELVFELKFGTTTAITGSPKATLPTRAENRGMVVAEYTESGVGYRTGLARLSIDDVQFLLIAASPITATTPFTWDTGDLISFHLIYTVD